MRSDQHRKYLFIVGPRRTFTRCVFIIVALDNNFFSQLIVGVLNLWNPLIQSDNVWGGSNFAILVTLKDGGRRTVNSAMGSKVTFEVWMMMDDNGEYFNFPGCFIRQEKCSSKEIISTKGYGKYCDNHFTVCIYCLLWFDYQWVQDKPPLRFKTHGKKGSLAKIMQIIIRLCCPWYQCYSTAETRYKYGCLFFSFASPYLPTIIF